MYPRPDLPVNSYHYWGIMLAEWRRNFPKEKIAAMFYGTAEKKHGEIIEHEGTYSTRCSSAPARGADRVTDLRDRIERAALRQPIQLRLIAAPG